MKNKILLALIWSILFYTPLHAAYKYQIAAVLMFQNEADFLKEWIEYHKLIGIEHFYLFDNLSTDNYLDILQPYIDKGEVELFHDTRPSKNQTDYLKIQCGIYRQALELAKGNVKWLAIIDTDEFIVPLQTSSLLSVLNKYANYGGVYLNWLMFGHSNVTKVPSDRLMIEMLTMCQKKATNQGKSIVRPERVKNCSDPHRMHYHPPYFHVNTDHKTFDWVAPIADDKLLLHHYCFGDINHMINVKIPRRKKWVEINEDEYIAFAATYNARKNTTMMRFVPALRKRMGLSH